MRYCIFSDVHGNLEAFSAMIAAVSSERVDERISLGDIVGYGADPSACISELKRLAPKVLIAGNHEWGVLGLLASGYFNEYAAEAVRWTAARISPDEARYLKSFELMYETPAMTFVHGSLEQPATFRYVRDRDDADRTMRLSRTPLSFVGHSHRPGIWRMDPSGVGLAGRSKVFIEERGKYIINAGSVGQPRDGDPRGSYVIYDEGEGSVEIKRFSYDIKLAQEKIRKAALPAWLASRLAGGR
jgi:diadenosine tetraphosphatase ApaH/serine/threonine PP2A family protein phosphatase